MCNKMSDVRLSNASPTLERVDARLPDQVKPPVCRNLFGNLDREEFQKDCKATMQSANQEFAERWNYDVENDRPLSTGKWVAVNSPPEFYVRPPHKRQCPRENVDLNRDHKQDADENERSAGRGNGSKKKRASLLDGCSADCQTKQSRTDGDDDDDHSHCTVSLTSAEHTPSKTESLAAVKWYEFSSLLTRVVELAF